MQAKLSPLLAAAEVKFKDLRCFFREFAAKHNLHGAAGSTTSGPGARRVVIPVHIDGSTLFHFTAYAATADTLDKAGTAFIDEDVDAVKAVTAALWTGPRGLLRTFFGALDTSTLDSCFEFVFYLEGASSKYVNTTHSRLTFTYAVLSHWCTHFSPRHWLFLFFFFIVDLWHRAVPFGSTAPAVPRLPLRRRVSTCELLRRRRRPVAKLGTLSTTDLLELVCVRVCEYCRLQRLLRARLIVTHWLCSYCRSGNRAMFSQAQYVVAAVQEMMATPKTAAGMPACTFVCLPETASLENDQALLAAWLARGGIVVANDFDAGLLATQLPRGVWPEDQIGARVRLTAGLRAPCFASDNDNASVVKRYEVAATAAAARVEQRKVLLEAAKFNYDQAKEQPATVSFVVLCRCCCRHFFSDFCCGF